MLIPVIEEEMQYIQDYFEYKTPSTLRRVHFLNVGF
jgi:hypothetical protein